MSDLRLVVGEAVLVPLFKSGEIVDADPPPSLAGYVCVKVPGEIPPRWWVPADQLRHPDERG